MKSDKTLNDSGLRKPAPVMVFSSENPRLKRQIELSAINLNVYKEYSTSWSRTVNNIKHEMYCIPIAPLVRSKSYA